MSQNLDFLSDKINSCDAVLVGLGNELAYKEDRATELTRAFEKLYELVGNRNYFIVSENDDDEILKCGFDAKRVIIYPKENEESEDFEKKWNIYNSWLMSTMKKNLLIVELGVGFQNPNMIRWPFERIVYIGSGAKLVRVHRMFSQVDEKVKDKSESISCDSLELLTDK